MIDMHVDRIANSCIIVVKSDVFTV